MKLKTYSCFLLLLNICSVKALIQRNSNIERSGRMNSPRRKSNLYEAQEKKLLEYLMRDYNKAIRPVLSPDNTTEVTIRVNLLRIIAADAVNQKISLNIIIHQHWSDTFLTWDPENFSNISQLMVPEDYLWKPEIGIVNSVQNNEILSNKAKFALVQSDGVIKWSQPITSHTYCQFDLSNYPRDQQHCQLILAGWSYLDEKIKLLFEENHERFDMGAFTQSSEWEVTETGSSNEWESRSAYLEGSSIIVFNFDMSRMKTSESWWVITHLVFIIIIFPLIFLLSHQEKPIASIIFLLAVAVVMVCIEPKIPKSFIQPTIAQVAMAVFALASLITIFSISTAALSKRSGLAPIVLKTLMIDVLGRMICPSVIPKEEENVSAPKIANSNMISLNNLENSTEKVDHETDNILEHRNKSQTSEWLIIANVFDRILLYILCFICACLIFTLWGVHG